MKRLTKIPEYHLRRHDHTQWAILIIIWTKKFCTNENRYSRTACFPQYATKEWPSFSAYLLAGESNSKGENLLAINVVALWISKNNGNNKNRANNDFIRDSNTTSGVYRVIYEQRVCTKPKGEEKRKGIFTLLWNKQTRRWNWNRLQ